MKENTNTLILDMYGVILKERTGNFRPYTFEFFPVSEHERLNRLFDEERLFTKAGYGELSSYDFLSLLGYPDPEYHMRHYIEKYLTLDETFLPFAKAYSRHCDFVLLSTDISEWSAYITEYYDLNKYFTYKIVSGDVHCRKPDKKIYEIALNRIQRKAEECLFIDDSIANIESAKELGIPSVLFNRFEEAYDGDQVSSFAELDKLLRSL